MSFYKSIFKNLPFPCILFEKKEDVFVIKEANIFFCEVTHINGEELSGKVMEEVFPENPLSLGLKNFRESLEVAYTSQEPNKIEVLRYDLYDKIKGLYDLKYWEIENIPILDEVKNVWYILNVVKDITAEVLEKERCDNLRLKLDVRTEKHEQIIENITDGLFSLDRQGNFVSLNQGLIDIAETPETELLKMSFLPFCGEDHREEILKRFNAAMDGKNQLFEANFISGMGINKILEISIVPLKNDGIITGLYGIAKDVSRLKESEAALLRSERKFEALVQEGSDLIGILDLEGKYKFVSETSSSVLGITPMDFIGKTAFDYMHPEDQERVIKEFSELEFKNQIQIEPFRFRNAKGEWRWIETIATNLKNDPAIEGIVINSRDVTNHINSQKAIQESEERYRSFFENSMDAVMVTIPDGQILAANPGACKMFQRSEKELCLLGRAAVVDLQDPRLAKALKLRRDTGTATVELTFVRKDGTKFSGEITSSIFKDSEGNSRSSIIIRDITQRKLAEKAIKESEEKYRSFFENSLDGILLKSPDGKILAANTSACQMFQRTEKEICEVGRDGVVDVSDPRVALALKERSSTGKVMAEVTMVRKDGSIFPAALSSAIFEDANGEKLASIIIRDISEAKRAEQELKTSEAEYRKLFENSPLPNIIYDKDSLKILDVNQAALDHYGFTREEILQVTILDFVSEEDIPDLKKIISTFPISRGEVTKNGLVIRRKNGERILVETYGYELDYKGKNGRLIIFLDITEKEAALQNLKDKTEKLQIAQSIAKLGYWTYNPENDTVFWSDQMFNIWERDSNFQPNLKRFEETIHPEDLPAFREANTLALNGEKELDFEHRIILPNGKIKWVHSKGKLNKHLFSQKVVYNGTAQDITDRRNSLEKLVKSEARFRGLIQSQTNYVIRTDLQGRYTYGNKKFRDDFGWIHEQEEIVGQNSMISTCEYHHSRVQEVVQKCLSNPDQVFQAEIDKPANGGGVKTTLWDYIYLKGSALEPGEIQCIGIDITEKKKLIELLDEASRFARIGNFEIDCEKDTMYWSPVTKEIHEVDMDYDPTLELGILFYKEGESRNDMSNAYLKALQENLPYDLELQIVTSKGKERWVRKIGRPIFVDGKCVRINGSFQDITNIKNSEQKALKASEEKEIILESIGDAFCMFDKDWMVTYWNRHSETLLDCPKEKILGKNVWEIFADAIDTKFYTSYHKAVKEQSIECFEEYFERVQKWFEVTAYPSHKGISVYFKDITERKESELQIIQLNNNLKAHTEELVEANKGLEQFSFIVSHNLRSPLANIIGLADLIGNKDYPEEVKNNFLEALLDNVKRLDIVISDLNSILQVKVEMNANKEPVLLNNLVDAIKMSIQNLIEKEKVQITTHFDLPALHTVQSYLHSIFYNLITNSIKYRQPGVPPQIEIRSETKEGSAVITFEDNGLGIDLFKKGEQVFGLYKRFHSHIEGKGMGLFLVKTQVELLGGSIAIESEVNSGTKFTITFKKRL